MSRTSPQRSSAWPRRLLVGAVAALAAACARPPQPLRVGSNVWPGYEPLFLARSLGLHRGQAIQLLEFSSASEVIRAYRDGLIDVAAVTADEALLASRGRTGDRVVLVCDFSAGADALLARRGIGSIAELRGKRLGVETTALGAYVLARALEHGGLTPSDVRVVSVPLALQVQALAAGTVDAVVTFEPQRTRLLAAGARSLFDSSQIPGEIVDVLLARGGLDAAQERSLRVLVASWFPARGQLQGQPAAAARREGLTPAEFVAALAALRLADRAENLGLLEDGAGNLAPTFRRLSRTLVQARLAGEELAPPALDPAYVREAAP